MAVFSVNQATQMYVGTPSKVINAAKDQLYFTVGTETTDLIKKEGFLYETIVKVSAMNSQVQNPKIDASNLKVGDEVIIRLNIVTDAGAQYSYLKTVAVLISGDLSTTSAATQIKNAIDNAAKRDIGGIYYETTVSGNVVTIKSKLEHVLGKKFVIPIITATVTKLTSEGVQALDVVTYDAQVDDGKAGVKGSGLAKLKDLEYFCAGEKGDVYRGSAYPNDIPFESKLDAVTDDSYVHTIHYAESLDNEAVQKSEKTMIIIGGTNTAVVSFS